MQIRFWGTRGSLPTPTTGAQIREKLRVALWEARGKNFASQDDVDHFIDTDLDLPGGTGFGGDSSCVQVSNGAGQSVIFDLGSGSRRLADEALRTHGPANPQTYHVVMSHLHWDHIMGFPFFTPAYIPGNTIIIHGCHAELEAAFRAQHSAPSFPVPFEALGADIQFRILPPDQPHTINGLTLTAQKQLHEGDSYSWRVEADGKAAVYSTDAEHKPEALGPDYPTVSLFRDADVVIFDAMYSLADAVSVKEDWGHSSNMIGVELAKFSGLKHLVLFHHEPVYDDAMIAQIEGETRRLAELNGLDNLKVTAAYDGLSLEI